MRRMTSFTVVLLWCLWSPDTPSAAAMAFFDEGETDYADTVVLRDVTPPGARSRRSLPNMPDHLHLDFHTGSERVALRLRRSAHMEVGKVAVFTVGDDQQLQRATLPDVTDAAVYRDVRHGAAVLVTRPHSVGAEFKLHGTLHIGDRQYTISPTSSPPPGGAASSAMSHVLRIVQNDVSYGMDYVNPEPEEVARPSGNDVRGKSGRARRETKSVLLDEVMDSDKHQPGRHNVDINIVCDYACYTRFYERHAQNETRALEEARLYFSYLAQSADVRFRSVSEVHPDVTITVTPVSIITAKTPGGSKFSEENRVEDTKFGVNGNKLLSDFRTWVSDADLPKAATTVLQTGYNMMTSGEKDRSGQLGIGYRGGACGYSGVVVVEEKFHGITGMVMAHEMGHNLNSMHDGAYKASDAECAGDGGRYVMSTYIGVPQGSSKPWTFSPCSADSIVKFVTVRRPSCFKDTYDQVVPDDAGQVYDADQQCSIAFGAGSYFCRGRQRKSSVGFKGMCTKMYCSMSPAVDNTCTSVIPFEYTSCGHRMWCVEGQCVYDEQAPAKTQDNCAQGDDPSYGCNRASCRTSLGREVFCCQTCSMPFTSFTPTTSRTRRPNTRRVTVRSRLSNSVLTQTSPADDSNRKGSGVRPSAGQPGTLPTNQRPASTITATPATIGRRQRGRRVFIPYVCRVNRFLCSLCLRSNFAYSFCRF